MYVYMQRHVHVSVQYVANGDDICVYVCVGVHGHAMNYVYKKMENGQKIVTYTIVPKLISVL